MKSPFPGQRVGSFSEDRPLGWDPVARRAIGRAMEDGRARTLEELGKEFNVTRERVRQIEAKALRKLRHPSRAKRLRDYLDE